MLKQKYNKIINEVAFGSAESDSSFVESGFKELDKKLNGGFRQGCSYLFAGLEKSGKSSFLFNIIHERLMNGKPTGILSTEMEMKDLTNRLITIAGVGRDDESGRDYWKRQVQTYFSFYGKEELTINTDKGIKHHFPNFLKAIDEMESEGIDFVIVDNLTTLGAEAGDYKVLGAITNQLTTHIKNKKMAVVYIIHVKPETAFRDSADGVRQMVKEGRPEQIMKDSITVVNRPSLKDVYGGGQAHSQISGAAIMLWRPFQKYDAPKFQRMGLIIIDSHRFGPSCDLEIEYDGSTGKFWTIQK
jgi:replicative DNA helicase